MAVPWISFGVVHNLIAIMATGLFPITAHWHCAKWLCHVKAFHSLTIESILILIGIAWISITTIRGKYKNI